MESSENRERSLHTTATLASDSSFISRHVTKYGLTRLTVLELMLEPTTSRLWDLDWSRLIQTKSKAVSVLTQTEFQWSDSEFLAPGEAPTQTVLRRPIVRHFGSPVSLRCWFKRLARSN